MDLKCKLVKKTFTADNGEVRIYHVLVFDLTNEEKLEITIKGDKAKLLILNEKLNANSSSTEFPNNPFWSADETKSLKE